MATSTNTLSELVASEIRAWLGRRRLTGRQLAAKMGTSQTWTATRLRGEQEISLGDLQRFAEALDVPITALLPTPETATTHRGDDNENLNRRSPLAPNQPMPAPGYATPTLTNPPPMTRLNGYTERRSADPATRRPVRLTTPTADSAS